ncbi:hypothetical protein TUM12147_43300 [Citrobacter europaeus]|nr:hypothetical protein TUM12147_43300 [Citrobacter europaeus]GIZ25916.1 hypothetical protein TUM12148_45800 [Citrobacter europaeus]
MLSWVNGLKPVTQHCYTRALTVYRSIVRHAINPPGQTAGDRHAACCKLFTKQPSPAFAIPGVLSAADNGHLERAEACGVSYDKKHPRIILNRTEQWRVMIAVGNHKMVVWLLKPAQRFFQRLL